jgi:lysophospholipase L1-like esterase
MRRRAPAVALALAFVSGVAGLLLLELAASWSVGALAARRREDYVASLTPLLEDRAAADAYWRESRELVYRIGDHGLWRAQPFAGSALNVDAEGLRATVSPAPPAGARTPEVAVFGGSTVWGPGLPDDATIPSLLAAELAAAGRPARVRNHGGLAYVSSSETVALLAELQAGARPDVVVFLDGVNDVLAAEFMAPDATYASRWLELSEPVLARGRAGSGWRRFRRLLSRSALAGLLRRPRAETGPPEGGPDERASRIVRRYLANVAAVRALAPRFGFTPLFYWQPVVTRRARLSEAERRMLSPEDHLQALAPVFEAAAADVRRAAASIPELRDIGGLLSEESAVMYVDGLHYTRAADALIARRIAPDVARALAGRR